MPTTRKRDRCFKQAKRASVTMLALVCIRHFVRRNESDRLAVVCDCDIDVILIAKCAQLYHLARSQRGC